MDLAMYEDFLGSKRLVGVDETLEPRVVDKGETNDKVVEAQRDGDD